MLQSKKLRRESPTLPVIIGGQGFQAGGAEIAGQYPGVGYVASLDELDVCIQQF